MQAQMREDVAHNMAIVETQAVCHSLIILRGRDRLTNTMFNNILLSFCYFKRIADITFAAYCGDGCQSGYGSCDAPVPVTPVDDFTCGSQNSNNICSGSLCCSQAGYCGNTTDYCDAGCQSNFGSCTAGAEAPAGSGTCGPNFGNAVCSNVCTTFPHCVIVQLKLSVYSSK
jgi:hypothetical protein